MRHSVGVTEREPLPVPHCDGDSVPEGLPLNETESESDVVPVPHCEGDAVTLRLELDDGLPEIELVRHSVGVGETE